MSLMEIFKERNKMPNLIWGLLIGIVTNNQDPDNLGRVKVKIPVLSNEDESNWARVVTLMAGNGQGVFFLPEIDSEVLVGFENGDVNKPYVLGSLWNGVNPPPETNSDGKNNLRLIKSRSGHLIRLNDEEGSESIIIADKTGKNLIEIDTAGNKITINSEQDIEFNAKNGKITLTATDVVIKTSAATTIEASAGMDLKASGNMTIKGATVNIN